MQHSPRPPSWIWERGWGNGRERDGERGRVVRGTAWGRG